MIDAFPRFSSLIRRTSGIVLDNDKQFSVESRLLHLARQRACENVSALVARLLDSNDQALLAEVTDALTTNETFFFRDRTPFDQFDELILPYLLKARASQRSIRIWCTACSTGQEPYSLAMTLDQRAAHLRGWRVRVQATDISGAAITAAREGLYNQFEVQRGMPANFLLRYFSRDKERWRISEHLRSSIRFTQFNLLNDFDERGEYDVIFCRNVLIYFDAATRVDILGRLSKVLRPDGFLILGATETIAADDPVWSPGAHPMLFVRPDGVHAARSPASA